MTFYGKNRTYENVEATFIGLLILWLPEYYCSNFSVGCGSLFSELCSCYCLFVCLFLGENKRSWLELSYLLPAVCLTARSGFQMGNLFCVYKFTCSLQADDQSVKGLTQFSPNCCPFYISTVLLFCLVSPILLPALCHATPGTLFPVLLLSPHCLPEPLWRTPLFISLTTCSPSLCKEDGFWVQLWIERNILE